MRQASEWYERNRHKLSKRLHRELRANKEDAPIPVIVIMHDDVPAHDREIHDYVKSLGGEIQRELPLIRGFSTALPARALAEIGPHDKIRRLHLDRRCRTYLDIGRPAIHADLAQAAGITGQGVTIAILDTGIHPHADFTRPQSRLVAWQDYVNNRRQPYDDHGHGTNVAGIAAGNGYVSGGKYCGVAPEAGIAAIKIADAEGEAPMSQLLDGLQWVVDNKERYNIRVANLSLGSDPSESYREDPLCLAAEQVWQAGIVVVAAAGNDGPKRGTIDTPGIDPTIITVGAVDDGRTIERGDDYVPDFSSRGPTSDGLRKPDLLAPGVGIIAPQAGGSYVNCSGTSMSTPFVSGASALLLSQQSDITPAQVKARLCASADRLRLPIMTQGAGYLNVQKLTGFKAGMGDVTKRPMARRAWDETDMGAVMKVLLWQLLKRKLLDTGQDLSQLLLPLIMVSALLREGVNPDECRGATI